MSQTGHVVAPEGTSIGDPPQKLGFYGAHPVDKTNVIRELQKIADVLETAAKHFEAEAEMNAALHMSSTVRPAPLAMAVAGARDDAKRLIETMGG